MHTWLLAGVGRFWPWQTFMVPHWELYTPAPFPLWCSRHTSCVLKLSSVVGDFIFGVCWCHYQLCTQLHSKTDFLGVCKSYLCSRAKVSLPEIHPQCWEGAQTSHTQTLSSQLSEQNTSQLQKITPALSSKLESENSVFKKIKWMLKHDCFEWKSTASFTMPQ